MARLAARPRCQRALSEDSKRRRLRQMLMRRVFVEGLHGVQVRGTVGVTRQIALDSCK